MAFCADRKEDWAVVRSLSATPVPISMVRPDCVPAVGFGGVGVGVGAGDGDGEGAGVWLVPLVLGEVGVGDPPPQALTMRIVEKPSPCKATGSERRISKPRIPRKAAASPASRSFSCVGRTATDYMRHASKSAQFVDNRWTKGRPSLKKARFYRWF